MQRGERVGTKATAAQGSAYVFTRHVLLSMPATDRLHQLCSQLRAGDHAPSTHGAVTRAAAASAAGTEIAARLMANSETLPFSARRSAVYATHGMVACSQAAASEIGLRILQSGGNAVDAAVAIGAALNLTEGMSTGLGGDCFILFKPAGDPKVYALNGSGRAAASLTSAQVRADCAKTYGIADPDSIEDFPGDRSAAHIHSVTVPGAADGWASAVAKWGKLSLAEVLEPAAVLAEEGFPVSQWCSKGWGSTHLLDAGPYGKELLVPDGSAERGFRAPHAGEIFKNPSFAKVLRTLGSGGPEAFYTGYIGTCVCVCVCVCRASPLSLISPMEKLSSLCRVFPGQAIVDVVQELGGALTMYDVQNLR